MLPPRTELTGSDPAMSCMKRLKKYKINELLYLIQRVNCSVVLARFTTARTHDRGFEQRCPRLRCNRGKEGLGEQVSPPKKEAEEESPAFAGAKIIFLDKRLKFVNRVEISSKIWELRELIEIPVDKRVVIGDLKWLVDPREV